ncbi:hypothetical protein [Nonomuraea endophytica]|uniref:Uncharacterized protein n=1 Tax=Nonomuraea endophytica TaxID=714136 RepID=A0A7W8EHT6_9ACTN|nr:hypothetical protein [Nonomuraea endophytica]MBB5079766.1 hypothetical protein [Nonomuraea endophytica]
MNRLAAHRRRWAFPVLAAALTFTLVPVFTAPAHAVLTQDPDTDHPPPGDTGPDSEPLVEGGETLAGTGNSEPNLAAESTVCINGQGATACFQKPGDMLWVQKTSSRPWATAKAQVYAWDRQRWRYIKTLYCSIDSRWAVGQWGYCNFDIWEDSTRNTWGGYGSGVRLRAVTNTGESTYRWIRNNDNSPG